MKTEKLSLKQLKHTAYRIACVTNTAELKRCYTEIAKMDMRRRHSWVKAVKRLRTMLESLEIFDDEYSKRQEKQMKQGIVQMGEMLGWSSAKTDLVVADTFQELTGQEAAEKLDKLMGYA